MINGQVYDAAQYFKTPTYTDNNVLTLTLNLTDISVSSGSDFYYNLYLADDVSCFNNCVKNYEQSYQPSTAVTLLYVLDNVKSGGKNTVTL